MYASHQLLRAHHDEWLRYAESRRLIKQAEASNASDASVRSSRRVRVRRPVLRFGRPLRHA
jgi:hypothetical protein